MMKACFLFLFLACTPTLLKRRDTYKIRTSSGREVVVKARDGKILHSSHGKSSHGKSSHGKSSHGRSSHGHNSHGKRHRFHSSVGSGLSGKGHKGPTSGNDYMYGHMMATTTTAPSAWGARPTKAPTTALTTPPTSAPTTVPTTVRTTARTTAPTTAPTIAPTTRCTPTERSEAGTVAFVVDTTASMEKAIPLAKQTIVNLVNSGSQIPKWILTEFKARGYWGVGVRVVTTTQDPEQFKASVQSLPIGGGGEEEALLAIQTTLQRMPNNGVILVFTDEPSAQLHLEQVITQIARTKNVKLFFALLNDPTQKCGPGFNPDQCLTGSASDQAFQRLSEGRVFRSSGGALNFDSNAFFNSVISHVKDPCGGSSIIAAPKSPHFTISQVALPAPTTAPAPAPATTGGSGGLGGIIGGIHSGIKNVLGGIFG